MNVSKSYKVRYLHVPKDGAPGPAGPQGPAGNDGQRGSSGPYIPPPMLFDDYEPDYVFLPGHPGDSRLDVVLEKRGKALYAYACHLSIKKGNSGLPSTDLAHWHAADAGRYKFVCTDVLWADNARIEFLSAQGIYVGRDGEVLGYFGAPAKNGEIIYTGAAEADDATFAVDIDGHVRSGKRTGARIEIDPADSPAIRIYDSTGALRSSIQSAWKDHATAIPGGSENTALPTAACSALSTGTLTTNTTMSYTVVSEQQATAAGSVTVNIPSMILKATTHTRAQQSGSSQSIEALPFARVTVKITLYGGASANKVLSSRTFYCTSTYSEAAVGSGADPGRTQTITTTATSITGSVAKNDKIKVVASVEVYLMGGTGSGGSGSASSSVAFSGRWVYSGVQCIYAANGYCISSNSDNYDYALFDTSGVLHQGRKANGKVIIAAT